MQIIDIDTYYPADNIDYRGNPLIELLPPLYDRHIENALTSIPVCRPSERLDSPELRMQHISRLFDLFFPTPEQTTLAVNIWNSICRTYVRRTPCRPHATSIFRAMCQAFVAGEPPAVDLTELSDLPNCIAVIGTPGCGKTQVVKRLLRRLSQDALFRHPKFDSLYQRLFIWAEAGTTKTDKALAEVVYEELYATVLATGATRARVRAGSSARKIGYECARLAELLNLGVLVIDEVQHWLKKKTGVDSDAVEFLTTLVNEIGCTVVLIGTWEALPILKGKARSGRRATSIGTIEMLKIEPGAVWSAFMQVLFLLQFTAQPVPCDDDLISTFWEYTQGVPDTAIRLMAFVQCEAIADESERIDKALIEKCATKHLQYIQPAIRQMRDGIKQGLPIVWDAQPENIELYTTRILAEYQLGAQSRAARRRIAATETAAQAGLAGKVLEKLGASPQQAEAMTSAVVKGDPKAAAADIVARVLKSSKVNGPRPTKNLSRKAAVAQQFAALPTLDIRRTVYDAGEAKSDVESALDDIGHLFHLDAWEVQDGR